MYTENRFPTARFKAKFKIEIIYNCNTCSEDPRIFININCNISMSFRLLTCSKAPIIKCPDNSLWLWSSLEVQNQTCKANLNILASGTLVFSLQRDRGQIPAAVCLLSEVIMSWHKETSFNFYFIVELLKHLEESSCDALILCQRERPG